MESGYWTPHHEMFDIGRTTSEAITKFKSGTPAKECGGDAMFDNGNGALMRIAPVAFTFLIALISLKKPKPLKNIRKLPMHIRVLW